MPITTDEPVLAPPPYRTDPSKPLTGVKLDPTRTGIVVGTDLYRSYIEVYLCGTQKTDTLHQVLKDSLQLQGIKAKPTKRVLFRFESEHKTPTDLKTILVIRPNTTSVDDLVNNVSQSESFRSRDESEEVDRRARRTLPNPSNYSQPKPKTYQYTYSGDRFQELFTAASVLSR